MLFVHVNPFLENTSPYLVLITFRGFSTLTRKNAHDLRMTTFSQEWESLIMSREHATTESYEDEEETELHYWLHGTELIWSQRIVTFKFSETTQWWCYFS